MGLPVSESCGECGGRLRLDERRAERACDACGLVDPMVVVREVPAPLPSESVSRSRVGRASGSRSSAPAPLAGRVCCGLCRLDLFDAKIKKSGVGVWARYTCARCGTVVTVTLAKGAAALREWKRREAIARVHAESLRASIMERIIVEAPRPSNKSVGRRATVFSKNDLLLIAYGVAQGDTWPTIAKRVNAARRERGEKPTSRTSVKRRAQKEGWA